MANNKTLELSIKIAGKMDKSLMAALNGSQSQISSFARSISSIGTAGLAAMGTLPYNNGEPHAENPYRAA